MPYRTEIAVKAAAHARLYHAANLAAVSHPNFGENAEHRGRQSRLFNTLNRLYFWLIGFLREFFQATESGSTITENATVDGVFHKLASTPAASRSGYTVAF